MSTAMFESATEARANFKDVLDRAEAGVSVPVRRGSRVSAMVDAVRLRHSLMALLRPDTQVLSENGEWSAYIPSIPSISATGDTLDEVVEDLVSAAREYAVDWNDHLRHAPNHADNWGFVQVVLLSDDEQLSAWLAR
ncbi:prevent-host-death protein [Oerskovia turbata]|uniref:Prevent-host-death protein n=1 Tax=Oerskovia turbata TaxID=1713 RepID=A0A4Q1KIH1_9CELL|nr:hypothetical protein [Oerskovia turbata]RXR21559.1 prevent-host-death protein [Oerskovia turbata]RXR29437.1 prevent-host-death protein [Oerskovia turbata]TGJ96951.1 prevent-host-death protein [Actinotalea fermentans ATCC 43279 = JCM 9966 = DSM 3133]